MSKIILLKKNETEKRHEKETHFRENIIFPKEKKEPDKNQREKWHIPSDHGGISKM